MKIGDQFFLLKIVEFAKLNSLQQLPVLKAIIFDTRIKTL